jgi:hypothetical protein
MGFWAVHGREACLTPDMQGRLRRAPSGRTPDWRPVFARAVRALEPAAGLCRKPGSVVVAAHCHCPPDFETQHIVQQVRRHNAREVNPDNEGLDFSCHRRLGPCVTKRVRMDSFVTCESCGGGVPLRATGRPRVYAPRAPDQDRGARDRTYRAHSRP